MAGKTAKTYVPTDYGKRLKQALKVAGYVDETGKVKPGLMAKLGEAIGISGSAVGQVLSGQTKKLEVENSARAAKWLKVDHFWLATGEGEPVPQGLSEEAQDFARRYDRLNPDGRRKFSAAIILAQPGVSDEKVERDMPITAKKAKQQPQES